jgi:hypothetical protein
MLCHAAMLLLCYAEAGAALGAADTVPPSPSELLGSLLGSLLGWLLGCAPWLDGRPLADAGAGAGAATCDGVGTGAGGDAAS